MLTQELEKIHDFQKEKVSRRCIQRGQPPSLPGPGRYNVCNLGHTAVAHLPLRIVCTLFESPI